MSVEDIQITATARKVLTSQWIDITQVHVRTTRAVIHITGHLHRMTYEYGDLTEKNLQSLHLLLRGLRSVRSVYYELDNWKRDALGAWRRITPGLVPASDTPPPAPASTPPTSPIA